MLKRRLIHTCTGIAVFTLSVLFLVCGESATEAARDSMHLAAVHVLPSLFPYMVLSSVIVSLDLTEPIYRRLPVERLFRLPRASAAVILCGMLGGFPVGALGACKLYERGGISRADAARLCAISSNTSPAFIVGTVGGMWGRSYAITLLAAQLISSLAIGAVMAKRVSYAPSAPAKKDDAVREGTALVLCRAISESSLNSVAICGYIVFFRVTAAMLSVVLPPLSDVFAVLFEFSSGAALGASRGGLYGICLTGFAVGFSGFSVFMQTANLTERHSIPFAPIFFSKLAQGAIIAAVSAVFCILYSPAPSAPTFSCTHSTMLAPALAVIAVLSAAAIILRKLTGAKYFTRRY